MGEFHESSRSYAIPERLPSGLKQMAQKILAAPSPDANLFEQMLILTAELEEEQLKAELLIVVGRGVASKLPRAALRLARMLLRAQLGKTEIDEALAIAQKAFSSLQRSGRADFVAAQRLKLREAVSSVDPNASSVDPKATEFVAKSHTRMHALAEIMPEDDPAKELARELTKELFDYYYRQGFLAEASDLLHQTSRVSGTEPWWLDAERAIRRLSEVRGVSLALPASAVQSPTPMSAKEFAQGLEEGLRKLATVFHPHKEPDVGLFDVIEAGLGGASQDTAVELDLAQDKKLRLLAQQMLARCLAVDGERSLIAACAQTFLQDVIASQPKGFFSERSLAVIFPFCESLLRTFAAHAALLSDAVFGPSIRLATQALCLCGRARLALNLLRELVAAHEDQANVGEIFAAVRICYEFLGFDAPPPCVGQADLAKLMDSVPLPSAVGRALQQL